MTNKIIEVQNIKVNITNINDSDYICISDFTKFKDGKSTSDDVIRNWLRNRITLEFLGTWESIYNPNFNSVEFDGFKSRSGLHTFTLSVTEWCEKTNAIGIYSKRGKYGGTYAHKDIAFEFASAISPVFKLYLIKEFERLKDLENSNREWDVKRILTKNNYLIHTDAVKNYILPDNDYYKDREWLKYAEEADILNGKTIFWDIDGTLAPYRFNNHVTASDYSNQGMSIKEIEENIFLNRKPSRVMQNIIKNTNIFKNIIMGHCINEKEISDKQKWLDIYFPFIEDRILVYEKFPKGDCIIEYCQKNSIELTENT